MLHSKLILVALVAAASANVLQGWPLPLSARIVDPRQAEPIAILRSASDMKEDGSFAHRYTYSYLILKKIW